MEEMTMTYEDAIIIHDIQFAELIESQDTVEFAHQLGELVGADLVAERIDVLVSRGLITNVRDGKNWSPQFTFTWKGVQCLDELRKTHTRMSICPTCGGVAIRLKHSSADPDWLWYCQHPSCGVVLPNNGGKPTAVEECPICQCRAVVRHSSKRKPGLHFHRCAACGQFFCDNNGKVGEAFGLAPQEIVQDLQMALICDTVADLETAMAKNGMRKLEIRRRVSVLEQAGHITLDPTIPGIGLSVAENPIGSYI